MRISFSKGAEKATLLRSHFFYCLESTTVQGYALLAKRLSPLQRVDIGSSPVRRVAESFSAFPSHSLFLSLKGTGPDKYSAS